MKTYTEGMILKNELIGTDIYQMDLQVPEIAKKAKAGQFLNIYLKNESLILPRPISISAIYEKNLSITYQVVGNGTKDLSTYQPGDTLNIAGPMGNGFLCQTEGKAVILGGGIGVPPLLALVKQLLAMGMDQNNIAVFLGFRTQSMMLLKDDFLSTGAPVFIATDDGSEGFHGHALDHLIASGLSAHEIYACGPLVMLEQIALYGEKNKISTQVCLEERMACGFGACVGCAVKIRDESGQGWHYKKVCKDGPVFMGQEVIWHE